MYIQICVCIHLQAFNYYFFCNYLYFIVYMYMVLLQNIHTISEEKKKEKPPAASI